jgi:hypothetical protein
VVAVRSFDIAVDHHREQPAFQVPRIVPAFHLDFFGAFGVLAMGARRVRVAAVGADQPVHHQLER